MRLAIAATCIARARLRVSLGPRSTRTSTLARRAASFWPSGMPTAQVEMLVRVLKSGGRVAEIPIIFEERRHGKSEISRAEVFRAIGTVLRLSRER